MAQQLSGNDLQGWDGYIALPLTPVYGSATTFTYPADLTGILDAGDKIKVTNNGSTKYFYVLPPVTFSAGSSTVTITGGSDYSLVNSGSPVMASLYYSKMATPHGFPQWFNYTATWTGFSSAPAGGARFTVNGRTCTVATRQGGGGTSNATTTTMSLPITASGSISTSIDVLGGALDNSTWQTAPGVASVSPGATVANMYKAVPAVAWTASSLKVWMGLITYEI